MTTSSPPPPFVSAAEFTPNGEQIKRLNRWRVSTFWVMLIGYIGYYLIRGNLAVAMPLLNQTFGYTNSQLGAILSFSELVYAIGKFTTGPLADQLGGKKIFMTGMVGGIIFNFLFPLYHSIFYFTVIWCCVRFFLSMGWSGIIKTIGEWYEPERNGTIMGLISVNFQFGGVLASLFAGLLIYLGFSWQGLFFGPALVVTVIAIVSFFASKESPQKLYPHVRFGKTAGQKKSVLDFRTHDGKKHSALHIAPELLRLPLFRQVLVFAFLTTILRSFFMFWIPKFMVDMGMGNVSAAFTSAVFPLVGCVGTVALGWYTDRYATNGNRAAAMWKMLLGLVISLSAVALIIPFGHDNQTAIVILLGLSGLFLYGPYSMSAGCMTLDIAGPEGSGTCAGIVDGVGYVGGALAAWGAGSIADQSGWTNVFWTLTGFSLLSVIWAMYMSWYSQNRATSRSQPPA